MIRGMELMKASVAGSSWVGGRVVWTIEAVAKGMLRLDLGRMNGRPGTLEILEGNSFLFIKCTIYMMNYS